MKNKLFVFAGLVGLAAFAYGLDLTDIPNESAFPAAKAIINANNALLELSKTNVTAQTATLSAVVTPQAGATITATGTVAIVGTWQVLTNVYADVTNVFYAPTAVLTATSAINVLNGAGLLTNATATVAGVTTNVAAQ